MAADSLDDGNELNVWEKDKDARPDQGRLRRLFEEHGASDVPALSLQDKVAAYWASLLARVKVRSEIKPIDPR